MTVAEECEAKFLMPDAEALRCAVEAVRTCGGRVGPPRHIRMRDLYLDTADRWLLRAGLALRVRLTGRRAVLTLKTRRAAGERVVRRLEWEEEHAAARIRVPGKLPRGRMAAWLRRSLGPVRLERLVEFHHDRVEYPVDLPGKARAKLCLDIVHLSEPAPGETFHEVEIELTEGSQQALKRLARRLEKDFGWEPDAESKLERVMRRLGIEAPEPPSGDPYRIRRRQRLAEAAWQALRWRFAQFRWNEPGARAGLDPEYLHDMRVAARRMRAALRIFRGALPAEFVERADRDLKFFFADMGRVRDLDVGLTLLRQRAGNGEDDGVAAWVERLSRRRERAWNRLLRGLSGSRYVEFIAFMETALAGPPPAADDARADWRVGEAAPRLLRRRFRKALAAARALTEESPEAEFHEVRIRFKKLRYALEFFADLHPRATRKLYEELVEIQDTLGEFQDEVVLRSLLLAEPEARLTDAMKAARERLLRQIAERIRERQREFLRLRERLDSKAARKLIAKLTDED